ncbi:MAG: AraC family transcriptional regulator [Firmicutes bacterium]|nr:AraC family transcriptional regulator [Bacillota bacterium]
MDDLRERVAYLQGLAEGLKLEEGKDEAKIIKQIIDILADLVDEVEELRVAQEDLEDYLESLDEDLEDEFEDEEEEEALGDEDEEEEEEEDGSSLSSEEELDYVEMECPRCRDIICFEADLVDDEDVVEITCPNCNEVVFVNDGSMPLPQGYERRRGRTGAAPLPEKEEEDL